MYEDLNQIASLKFNKEREASSTRTLDGVREAQNQYAALTSGYVGRSGLQDAKIGRIYIEGAKQIGRALYEIWIELIE